MAVKSDKTSEGWIMAEAPYPYPCEWHQPHDLHGIPVRRIAKTNRRKFHAASRNRIESIQRRAKIKRVSFYRCKPVHSAASSCSR